MAKNKTKKAINVIRKMNPDKWIPSGAEMAKLLKQKYVNKTKQ